MRRGRSRRRYTCQSERRLSSQKLLKHSWSSVDKPLRWRLNKITSSRIKSSYSRNVSLSWKLRRIKNVAFIQYIATSIANWTMRHVWGPWKSKKSCKWKCSRWNLSKSCKTHKRSRKRLMQSLRKHFQLPRRCLDRMSWKTAWLVRDLLRVTAHKKVNDYYILPNEKNIFHSTVALYKLQFQNMVYHRLNEREI